jgi:hypothetical protein
MTVNNDDGGKPIKFEMWCNQCQEWHEVDVADVVDITDATEAVEQSDPEEDMRYKFSEGAVFSIQGYYEPVGELLGWAMMKLFSGEPEKVCALSLNELAFGLDAVYQAVRRL